ncbi:hypothetical protein PICSAR132_00755 [Mycobacterium avium subsp. paratuberculosis]|nr:hypothetical protein B0172_04308 [Mycobacterium avium subsp. paratuberculosis]CAG6854195.1 hypothetical protein PICSAR118_00328 [Mycobacterium avium subsp. paratuberculosis]CAG6855426.1 hypothetical protein PICSAR120_00332 [Mycobacterium avium subsp. paratuberculosis]CAG6859918.1 hypothetical protein PICSAR107_00564 [Mycobacterium avium subsp. paratuberculosis]CAG6862846.1 hypothetical protein PICSAR106_00739 [Mycobacterium avium subsp. paratuberculosis]
MKSSKRMSIERSGPMTSRSRTSAASICPRRSIQDSAIWRTGTGERCMRAE